MSLTRLDLPDPLTPVTATKQPSGKATSTFLQVVLARALDDELAALLRRPAQRRDGDAAPAGQVGAGDRLLGRLQLVDGAGHHDAAAVLAGLGPMSTIQSATRMVSSSCSTTIRVLPRFFSRTRVSMSRWLSRWCSPIDGSSSTYSTPTRPGADLGRQPDALRLAAGQRRRGTVEREVVQADVDEEAEPGVDLLEHARADHRLALVQVEPGEPRRGVPDRQRRHLGDRAALDRDGEDLRLEPGALARRAGHLAHVALVLLARVVAVGLGVAPLDPRHDALVGRVVRAVAAVAVAVADVHLLGRGRAARPSARAPAADSHGSSMSKPRVSATPCSSRRKYSLVWPVDHGVTAPSARLRSGSGTTSSGSTSLRVPRPVQAGHAPKGELKENERGSSSSMASGWSFGQASRSEKRRSRCGSDSSRSTKSSTTTPPASPSAGLDRVGDALLARGAHREPVDDRLDGVLLLLLQLRRVGERVDDAVDAGPGEALGLQVGRAGRRTRPCARG